MFSREIFRSRILAAGLAAAFLLLATPVLDFAQAKAPAAPSGGSLVGFVYDADMKTPVSNAVVLIWNVSSTDGYESRPSDENGMYKIAGIKEGRYTLEVTTVKGSYKFSYEMLLKASETAKLSVALVPNAAGSPAAGGPAAGTAAGSAAGGRQAGGSATGNGSGTRNLIIGSIMVVTIGGMLAIALSEKSETSPIR
ncbi:MAG TPA: carboxypeptidase-like regulatory domain-containing protein [Terriglobales bacterium]|nr:carboxypeptidase-like regulatory domain-containing protein [Terriglobales bacterium]